MTLKELSKLYNLKKEIKITEERLASLRARAYSPASPHLSGMPLDGNNGGSRTENSAVAITELERVIKLEKAKSVAEKIKLEKYIASIPDPYIRLVFTLRFSEGLTWFGVAKKIGGTTEQAVKMTCYRYLEKN